jgi:hypothetical protein
MIEAKITLILRSKPQACVAKDRLRALRLLPVLRDACAFIGRRMLLRMRGALFVEGLAKHCFGGGHENS